MAAKRLPLLTLLTMGLIWVLIPSCQGALQFGSDDDDTSLGDDDATNGDDDDATAPTPTPPPPTPEPTPEPTPPPGNFECGPPPNPWPAGNGCVYTGEAEIALDWGGGEYFGCETAWYSQNGSLACAQLWEVFGPMGDIDWGNQSAIVDLTFELVDDGCGNDEGATYDGQYRITLTGQSSMSVEYGDGNGGFNMLDDNAAGELGMGGGWVAYRGAWDNCWQ